MVRFIELSLLFHKSFNFYVFCSVSPHAPRYLSQLSPRLLWLLGFQFSFFVFIFPHRKLVINLRLDACPNMPRPPLNTRWFIGSVFDSLPLSFPPPFLVWLFRVYWDWERQQDQFSHRLGFMLNIPLSHDLINFSPPRAIFFSSFGPRKGPAKPNFYGFLIDEW